MINENIKALRKSRGLSAPDSKMLIALGGALDAPVSALMGEAVEEREPDDIAAVAAARRLRQPAVRPGCGPRSVTPAARTPFQQGGAGPK